MKNTYKLLFLLLTSGMLISSSQAQTLDNTFDTDGIRVITSAFNDEAHCVAIDANDKILVGGYLAGPITSIPEVFTVFRLNTDGTLDNTFNSTGKYTIPVDVHGGSAEAIKVMPDGKILIVGYARDASDCKSVAVVRLNSNGSLDNTFAGDGIANTVCVSGSSIKLYLNSFIIDSNGKIVIGGCRAAGGSLDLFVARFNGDGTVDNTFDTDGYLITGNAAGGDMKEDASGKYVLCGAYNYPDSYTYSVMRLNSDGSLDLSFDGDGYKSFNFIYPNGLHIDASGKIIIIGESIDNSTNFLTQGNINGVKIVRLNNDGTYDLTFDGDGIKNQSYFIDNAAPSVNKVIFDNNNFILFGHTDPGLSNQCNDVPAPCYNIPALSSTKDFCMHKFDVDGNINTFFGNTGTVIMPVNSTNEDMAFDGAIDSRGRIVTVGYVYTDNSSFYRDFGITRLTSTTTGINSNKIFEEISIYPNPGNGAYKIDLRSVTGKAQVTVRNITGAEVLNEEKDFSSLADLDLTDKPAGMYLVEIKEGEKIFRKKIIKSE